MGSPGKVFLVGAGPGDPGLITVRGLEVLRAADCIVFDRLAPRALLRLSRPEAERVFAGKEASRHALEQAEINDLLVSRARQGKLVCRLKGGDPFLFGRGGEEAERLAQEGIPFEVVPGVTSAIAVPAYAGIPVTHRDLSSSVGILTGHPSGEPSTTAGASNLGREEGQADAGRRWRALVEAVDTLVFLMAVTGLPRVTARLQEAGLAADTPAAVVEWGTTPRQRTLTGTLSNIAGIAAEEGLEPPAVLVVGKVAGLSDRLSWFTPRPLAGMRVLVTRSREQAGDLVRALEDQGAECVELATLRIEELETPIPLKSLPGYDWVLFTSTNAVRIFLSKLWAAGADVRAIGPARLAAVGPATAGALRQAGLRVDYLPKEDVAEGMLAAFPEDPAGLRILIPRAEVAREVLPEGLRARGATVDILPLYRSVPGSREEAAAVRDELARGEVHAITLLSGSAVRNLLDLVGREAIGSSVVVACLGPATAQAARDAGVPVHVVPEAPYTVPRLVEALASYVSAGRRSFSPGGAPE